MGRTVQELIAALRKDAGWAETYEQEGLVPENLSVDLNAAANMLEGIARYCETVQGKAGEG